MQTANFSSISATELHSILEAVRAETQVPAIGAAVSIRGVQVQAAVGLATLNRSQPLSERSRFEVSCLMKLIISLVALELASRGKFDLDASIGQVLSEFGEIREKPITARHLMTHTSGYRGVDVSDGAVRWGFTWDKLVAHLKQHARLFPPGRVFNYEHTEHILLAEMISRQSGRTAAQWVRELILEQAGIDPCRLSNDMRNSDAFVSHHVFNANRRGFVAATLPSFGSFWEASLPDSTITLQDMVAVGQLIQAAQLRSRDTAGLSAAALRDIHRCEIHLPRQVASDGRHERTPVGFGPAFAHYGAGLLGHNASASGQTTGLRLDLEREVVVAVGVNAYVPYARDMVIQRVFSKVAGRTQGAEAAAPEGFCFDELAGDFSSEQLLGRYVGSYFGSIDVSKDGAGLHLDLGSEHRAGRPRISVVPSQNKRFLLKSPVPTLAGFFADPVGGEPVLAMGVHSYKKQLS